MCANVLIGMEVLLRKRTTGTIELLWESNGGLQEGSIGVIQA